MTSVRRIALWIPSIIIGLTVWLVLSTTSGCGGGSLGDPSDGGSSDGSPVSVDGATIPLTPRDAACRTYVEALCNARRVCARIPYELPDKDCQQMLDACPDFFFADGSTREPEELIACAGKLEQFACKEISQNLVPSCTRPGTKAAGAPCVFDSQCASEHCVGRGACKTCGEAVRDGEPCGDLRVCGRDATCDVVSKVCVRRVDPPRIAPGARCPYEEKNGICTYLTTCVAGERFATCQDLPSEGSACANNYVSGLPACRGLAFCARGKDDSTSSKCVRELSLNDDCDLFDDCCPPDLRCMPVDATGPRAQHVCASGAKEGAICSLLGDLCGSGLTCVSSRCTAKAVLGEKCTYSSQCVTAACKDEVCVLPVRNGEVCDALHICNAEWLECENGRCAVASCPASSP